MTDLLSTPVHTSLAGVVANRLVAARPQERSISRTCLQIHLEGTRAAHGFVVSVVHVSPPGYRQRIGRPVRKVFGIHWDRNIQITGPTGPSQSRSGYSWRRTPDRIMGVTNRKEMDPRKKRIERGIDAGERRIEGAINSIPLWAFKLFMSHLIAPHSEHRRKVPDKQKCLSRIGEEAPSHHRSYPAVQTGRTV
jgi:hypothetical protein